jgi:hypothetical protein
MKGRKPRKKKRDYTRIRKDCDFLRKKAKTAEELKGINVRKGSRIADRSIYTKLGAS